MQESNSCDNETVRHKDWFHEIFVGKWPIFCGPVTLLNILKTTMQESNSCDNETVWHKEIDIMKCILVSDLFFVSNGFA